MGSVLRKTLVLTTAFLCLALLVSGATCADEAQKAWLRMYASGSEYVYENPDDWIAYSYVIESGPTSSLSLTIYVKNHKGSQTVNDIVLTIVTNNTIVIKSIIVNGTGVALNWKTGVLPMTADDGTPLGDMPPHGVYNDPTASWVENRSHYDLGPAGSSTDTVAFSVTINFTSSRPGDVKIHFDTYGWIPESGKSSVIVDDTLDAALDAAFAPFSHDVTVFVPEIPFAVFVVTSVGVCCYLLLKRKLWAHPNTL